MTEEKCKAAEIYTPNQTWGVGKIAEKELVIESEGKENGALKLKYLATGIRFSSFSSAPFRRSPGTEGSRREGLGCTLMK